MRIGLTMLLLDSVAVATKTFASYDEDDILAPMKRRKEAIHEAVQMQTSLPDAGIFWADILQAMNEIRQAATVLSDRLFVLESLLEAVDDVVE
jgi:hypothetical protein